MAHAVFDKDDLTSFSKNGEPVEIKVKWVRYEGSDEATRFLAAVNHVLAKQRKYAWDHEAHDPEHAGHGDMFYGAALLKTKDGKFYLTSNHHVHADPMSRNCAEANAVTEAAQDVKKNELQVEELWFMGGKGNFSEGIVSLPGEEGKHYSPCGSCLDVIRNNRLHNGTETKIHMLPLNNGSWIIQPDRGKEKTLRTEVKTRTIEQLFPRITAIMDREGKLKQDIEHGWQFLNDPATVKAIEQSFDAGRIKLLEGEEAHGADPSVILCDIDKIMMETLAKEHQRENMPALKRATVAIVRTEDGSYRMGLYYDDGKTTATPSAPVNAIQNAGRKKVTDIFVLQVNMKDMPALIERFHEQKTADVDAMELPGAQLDRIFKTRPKGRSEFKDYSGQKHNVADGPMVHMFQVNDPREFDSKRDVQSYQVRHCLPEAFQSPKTTGAVAAM